MHEVPWKILPYLSHHPHHHTTHADSFITMLTHCSPEYLPAQPINAPFFLLHLHITLNPSVILLCNHPPSMFVSCQTLQKKDDNLAVASCAEKNMSHIFYFTSNQNVNTRMHYHHHTKIFSHIPPLPHKPITPRFLEQLKINFERVRWDWDEPG